MKKIFIIFACIIALSATIIIIKKEKKTTQYKIGILQTASHPALDAARDGFIDELTKQLTNSVEFVIQNAQGSITNAHIIAEKFHHDKTISAVYAIATPAAQAIATLETQKPIIIAAVTDPYALGIMHPTTNVCGTQDMIDIPAEISMLTTLLPDVHTIGLIYAAGEINSQVLAEKMRTELMLQNKNVLDFPLTSEADLSLVIETALRKTDALLAPTDNIVASSITLIASLCLKNKKPLIVSDNLLVASGPLAARGVDYYESGKASALIALKVLTQNTEPCTIPLKTANSKTIFINKTTLDALGLTIPASLESIELVK